MSNSIVKTNYFNSLFIVKTNSIVKTNCNSLFILIKRKGYQRIDLRFYKTYVRYQI